MESATYISMGGNSGTYPIFKFTNEKFLMFKGKKSSTTNLEMITWYLKQAASFWTTTMLSIATSTTTHFLTKSLLGFQKVPTKRLASNAPSNLSSFLLILNLRDQLLQCNASSLRILTIAWLAAVWIWANLDKEQWHNL